MQAIPKFKNSAPGLNHAPFGGIFVMHEMGLAKVYPCTKFEFSSFTRSKDTASAIKWLDARGGVLNSRVDLCRFLSNPTKLASI